MDRGGRIEVRMYHREIDGHRTARRHTSDIDASVINVVHRHDLTREGRDHRRFARLEPPVRWSKPVPALKRIGALRLLRVDNDVTLRFGRGIHLRSYREVV